MTKHLKYAIIKYSTLNQRFNRPIRAERQDTMTAGQCEFLTDIFLAFQYVSEKERDNSPSVSSNRQLELSQKSEDETVEGGNE